MLEDAILAVLRPHVVEAGGSFSQDEAQAVLEDALGGALLASSDLEAALDAALADPNPPVVRVGGHVADVETLVAGLVLTHQLTEEERDRNRLDLTLDLAAIGLLASLHGGLHLPDGTPLTSRLRRLRPDSQELPRTLHTVDVEGPAGWLNRFSAGDRVVATAGGGFLRLEPVGHTGLAEAPASWPDIIDALVKRLNEDNDPEFPVEAADVQLLAAIEHPELFAEPRPPLAALAEEAGFETESDKIGRPGSWPDLARVEWIVAAFGRHQLPDAEQDVLFETLRAFDAWREDPARGLSEPVLAGRLTIGGKPRSLSTWS